MSLNNFSTDLFSVTVTGNGVTIIISDWGETATPFTSQQIDPSSAIRRGQGGNACSLDRINPGEAVSVFLNPGSPNSTVLKNFQNSRATITMTTTQIGTLENTVGTEGRIVNKGARGRGGSTITDDQYDFEFNTWTELSGGS